MIIRQNKALFPIIPILLLVLILISGFDFPDKDKKYNSDGSGERFEGFYDFTKNPEEFNFVFRSAKILYTYKKPENVLLYSFALFPGQFQSNLQVVVWEAETGYYMSPSRTEYKKSKDVFSWDANLALKNKIQIENLRCFVELSNKGLFLDGTFLPVLLSYNEVLPSKFGEKRIPANGNIIVKSPDTIRILNPDETLRVKEISLDESCTIDITGAHDTLEFIFKKQTNTNIQGLIETNRKIVITESYGQIIRVKDNDEYPFTPDNSIEITLRPRYPNFNFYLKEDETLVKLYMDMEEPVHIIKNTNISHIRFYERESTEQPGLEFLDSTIHSGNIQLSTSNLLGEFFLFGEQSIEPGDLVTFSPDAVYFLKDLTCSDKILKVNMYNKNAREIKKGKHQDLLQSIFPSCLEWVIREPVTKKFSLLATAITGVIFLIIKLKSQLFPGKKTGGIDGNQTGRESVEIVKKGKETSKNKKHKKKKNKK